MMQEMCMFVRGSSHRPDPPDAKQLLEAFCTF